MTPTLPWAKRSRFRTRNWVPYAGERGVNRLAYEVDDVDSLHLRLKAAGYRESGVPNAHQ